MTTFAREPGSAKSSGQKLAGILGLIGKTAQQNLRKYSRSRRKLAHRINLRITDGVGKNGV